MHFQWDGSHGTNTCSIDARIAILWWRLHCTTDKNEIWREPSLWPVQLYGRVYKQQLVKLTACIRSDARSKHTCLLCVLMTD